VAAIPDFASRESRKADFHRERFGGAGGIELASVIVRYSPKTRGDIDRTAFDRPCQCMEVRQEPATILGCGLGCSGKSIGFLSCRRRRLRRPACMPMVPDSICSSMM